MDETKKETHEEVKTTERTEPVPAEQPAESTRTDTTETTETTETRPVQPGH